jgi:hypothetical protein
MPMIDSVDGLVVGKLYDVCMSDCCVEGAFRSVLTAINYENDIDGTQYAHDIVFENGVQLTETMKVEFTEVQ